MTNAITKYGHLPKHGLSGQFNKQLLWPTTGTEQRHGTSIRFRQRLSSVEGKHSVMF